MMMKKESFAHELYVHIGTVHLTALGCPSGQRGEQCTETDQIPNPTIYYIYIIYYIIIIISLELGVVVIPMPYCTC